MSMMPFRNAAIAALCSVLLEGGCLVYRASDIGHRLSEFPRFLMKALAFVATFPLLPLYYGLDFGPYLSDVGMVVIGPIFWGSVVFSLSRWRLNRKMTGSGQESERSSNRCGSRAFNADVRRKGQH